MFENIDKKYPGLPLIAEMRKKRSPLRVKFLYNVPGDPWLIHYIEYRAKSGDITYESLIIADDLQKRIDLLRLRGYELEPE